MEGVEVLEEGLARRRGGRPLGRWEVSGWLVAGRGGEGRRWASGGRLPYEDVARGEDRGYLGGSKGRRGGGRLGGNRLGGYRRLAVNAAGRAERGAFKAHRSGRG
ncbi:hypothetical protein CesoFtcFv8_022579 [Champsocephalus esox]|uniref:Uncharacterized protein n=1 Tax=Champsocephalus esox TaxID=159716 RepID=A0AAN8B708_9TELE|nr:hypothetical protein CesoFtcFv8_022579 [Champsocephalus esox]